MSFPQNKRKIEEMLENKGLKSFKTTKIKKKSIRIMKSGTGNLTNKISIISIFINKLLIS